MLALRLSIAAAASTLLAAALTSCGPTTETTWSCIDPATGKEDSNAPYDPTHYVDGVFDPCHCYDPGGELPQCPILVNGGPAKDAGQDAP